MDQGFVDFTASRGRDQAANSRILGVGRNHLEETPEGRLELRLEVVVEDRHRHHRSRCIRQHQTISVQQFNRRGCPKVSLGKQNRPAELDGRSFRAIRRNRERIDRDDLGHPNRLPAAGSLTIAKQSALLHRHADPGRAERCRRRFRHSGHLGPILKRKPGETSLLGCSGKTFLFH